MKRILDAGLLLLHLRLGGRADLDDGDAADQLGQTLLELLAVVVRGGVLDLDANLLHPRLDVGLLACPLDDRGVVLVDRDALGAAEVLERDALQLDAEILADGLTAGEDRDVLHHLLATIAEARRLHRADLQGPTQLVDHQGRQRLTVDVLGDDDQRTAALGHLLEQRQEVLHVGELLVVHENERVFQHGLHALRVGHEVGREVSAVELHPLDHVQRRLHRLGFFDGDDPFLADLLHRLGQDVADDRLAVGADGADLRDLGLALGRLGLILEVLDDLDDRRVDAALDVHRVVPGGDQLGALGVDRLRQHGRGGGAVTGDVGGLGGDLLHHLRAHVGELVFELDLLGDGDAVLGHRRRPPGLLDDDVTAAGPERHLDRVGQRVEPVRDALAGALRINDVFGCHDSLSPVLACRVG